MGEVFVFVSVQQLIADRLICSGHVIAVYSITAANYLTTYLPSHQFLLDLFMG